MRSATRPVQPVWWDAPRPGAGVAVEVLVERQQVVPARVGLQPLGVAEDRPAAVGSGRNSDDQPPGQVVGHLAEG